jgi:hypothetical protein
MDSFARGQNQRLKSGHMNPSGKGDKDVGAEIKYVNGFKNKKN